MAKDNKLWIDMCAGSELKDTQGETLSIEGADISDLQDGKGRLNDNHGKGFFNSLGRVTEAKKIFKSEDCENDRHKYYWEKIKAPFIYAKGYLFNNEDHPNAKAAAAILRNINREDAPLVMKASVEGGVIARGTADSSRLARTKIHSVALTFTPANNATLVEPVDLNKSDIDWEADKQLIKSVMHLAETNVPSFRHIQRHASANSIRDNILKIQELSSQLGIEVNIELPEPEVIMKNAVFKKIENNVKRINELVKSMKINHLGMIGETNKLTADPKNSSGFSHPELVNRWHGKGPIPEGHPDRQEMANYVNRLRNTPDSSGLNVNINEARRLFNDHLAKKDDLDKSDIGRAVKGGAIAIAMTHAAHYIAEPPVEVKDHASKIHRELESQKTNTVKEHNSRLGSNDIKLSNKEYGFDEKEPNVPHIQVKKQKLKAKLKKALLAGYGGAGAPSDMVGSAVIQPQSLETKRKKKIKNKLVKAAFELEELAKGKKELLGMYKDPAVGKDHVDWVTKTLPTAWHTWAVKNHRNNPESFTDETKEAINHFAGMAVNVQPIKQVRFDSEDNFQTGLTKLRQAEEQHNSKQKDNERYLEPDKDIKKISGDILGSHGVGNWYSLNKPYCEKEGKSMHHCGNIEGTTREDDNILSFRTETKDGKHKPHLTFIENNGWLGETKGYANSKPTKDNHRAIVELLKNPRIKGIAGGGYAKKSNFKFSDLSLEHQKEVLNANPSLVTDLDNYENISRALDSDLPSHHKSPISTSTSDPRIHEQLVNDEDYNVREEIASNPNLDPRFHEQLLNDEDDHVRAIIARKSNLDPRFHEKLVNDEEPSVRTAIASNPNLDPRFHERLVNDEDLNVRQEIASNPNLDPRFHEQLVNDEDPGVRASIGYNPDLDPRFHEKLVNDEDPSVNRAIAYNPNLDRRFHEQLLNNEDVQVHRIIARNPNLDPRFHEPLVNNKYSFMRQEVAYNPNLNPRFHEQLLNDKEPWVRSAIAQNPNVDRRFHEQLLNDEEPAVRSAIAQNPNLDPRFHERLVNDKEPWIRLLIASNPNLDPRFHEQLVNDEDPGVRSAIADNPSFKLKKSFSDFNLLVKKLYNLKNNLNKSLNYISCDNCGHEQVFMPHQVKCRECKQNFSLYRLNSLKS